MNRPRVFISTVTRELRGARQRVANILARKGYEPVTQDINGTEPGDIRAILRAKIETCHGLIQIIGDSYATEPQEPDADFGRCSYTQYEFLLARKLGKKTWLLIAGPGCVRDTPPAQLDLPRDPAHPDPAAWQSERQQLQRDYRQRPEVRDHLFHEAESDLALDLAVERLDDQLAALRKEFAGWQRTVLRLAAAGLILLGIVLGIVWWVKKGQDTVVAGQKEIQKQLTDGPKITTAGIRKQILLGSERKRDRDLAEAEGKPSIEREKLTNAALAAHNSRISRIDELATSFAEIEGRADATAVLREMTRILEQEGVDFALAYIGEQKAGIIERVRKRKEREAQQSRAELQPLLSAAKLQAAAGQSVAARASYRQILDLDPAWPSALDAYAWFLRDQSYQSQQHGTLREALEDAQEALAVAVRFHTPDPASTNAQRTFAAAHNELASVLEKRGQPGDVEAMMGHTTLSHEIWERLLSADTGSARAKHDFMASLEKLGDGLTARAHPGDAELALMHYTRSHEIAETLLKASPASVQAAQDVTFALSRLAASFIKRGQPGDAEKALAHYTRDAEICEKLLAADPGSASAARAVAFCLNMLGGRLLKRGQPGDSEVAMEHLTRSLEMREALLKSNPRSTQAVQDVSVSLIELGDCLAIRGQPGDAEAALANYTRSLEMREPLLKANPDSAGATRDVWVSCWKLAKHADRMGKKDEAVHWWRRAHDILAGMKAKGQFISPVDMEFLEVLREKSGQ